MGAAKCMRSFHERQDFKALLLADADVTRVLTPAEIERAFDLNDQLKARRRCVRACVSGGSCLMQARVFVTLKPSVFDPQGTTVAEALHTLGYPPSAMCGKGSTSNSKSTHRTLKRLVASQRTPPTAVVQSRHRELSHRGDVVKIAVVVFPGSNCDHDTYYVAKDVLGQDAELIWHKDTSLRRADAVILPGGFAHGDYLRTGAIARFSPIMPRWRSSRGWWAGARHLQRVPGSPRGRSAAGGDAAQPPTAIPLRVRARSRRAD
jgi:hypothetical protein